MPLWYLLCRLFSIVVPIYYYFKIKLCSVEGLSISIYLTILHATPSIIIVCQLGSKPISDARRALRYITNVSSCCINPTALVFLLV